MSGSAKTCEHCGITFYRRARRDDAARFCSKACGGKFKTANKAPPRPRETKPIVDKQCIQCGDVFTPANNGASICSDSCRSDRALYNSKRSQMRKAGINRGPRNCKGCGVEYTPEYGRASSVYCSDECGRKHSAKVSKHRRRAMIKGVGYEPFNVFDLFAQSGWCCAACGVPTPEEKRGSIDPDAPELDHIYPISLGGPHTLANAQLLCRLCNGEKSNEVSERWGNLINPANDNGVPGGASEVAA